MTSEDIREMSFQNVLDHVLKPAGVHVGGYPEEIFTDLSDDEKEKWICNICFLMVRDARECDNKHLFCHTCVFAWSLTYGENSQKCPMCRSHQHAYPANKEVDKLLKDKRVKCPEPSCTFRSPLGVFLMHSHGRQRFVNDQVDLESLRPARPPSLEQVIIFPGGIAMPGGMVRTANIREQLQQGRAMIHQMMLLLHLEMQLRQQALVSYSQAQDPDTRLRRLDEVLSLNEQLNEVGTILSALLSTPLATRAAMGRVPGQSQTAASTQAEVAQAPPRRVDVSSNVMMSRGATGSISGTTPAREVLLSRGTAGGGINRNIPIRQLRATPPSPSPENDEDEDEDSSDSETTSVSSVGSVVPRLRMSLNGQLNSPRDTATASNSGSLRIDLNRPMRRSEIRSHMQSSTSGEPNTSNTLNTSRLTRRETAGAPNTQNNGSYVELQRIDNRGSVMTSMRADVQGSSNSRSENQSSLPPLSNSNSVTRQTPRGRNIATGGNDVFANQTGNTPSVSPHTNQISGISGGSSFLPSGSSMHQRIIQSLNNDSQDENDADSDDGSLLDLDISSIQRPNSIARRSLAPIDGAVPRSLTVTSQGVTASGATFQTSADTPSTRAASRVLVGSSSSADSSNNNTQQQQPHAPRPNNGETSEVTPSGAIVSISGRTPEARTTLPIPTSVGAGSYRLTGPRTSTISRDSGNTGSISSEGTQNFHGSSTGLGSSIDQRSLIDDVFVSDSSSRPLSRLFAPQRRFRRDSSSTSSSSQPQGISTVNRHSRSMTVPSSSSSQVPYVPHRASVSPTRNVRVTSRSRRSSSNSVDREGGDSRRYSFNSREDPEDSVVRMAARGGNNTHARSSLPQTPGQLMRARRRSDHRRPHQGPGGTI